MNVALAIWIWFVLLVAVDIVIDFPGGRDSYPVD